MELIIGLLLLLAFLAVVVAIVKGQSPVVMLIILAIAWSALSGINIDDIQNKVLEGGGTQYAASVIIIVFGAWFAQVLVQTGIAESVIRSAVELAGDRPIVTAMVVTLVTALLFTSMYGVGAAIAIGVIAIPIMMSQGIPPAVAAPAFTMGIGAGTFVNLVQFGTMKPLFPGISYTEPWLNVWVVGMIAYILAAWLMVNVHMRLRGVRHSATVDLAAVQPTRRKRTPYYTYIVPLVPVFMVIVLQWQIIPTFLVSIVIALLATYKDRSLQGHINLFNKAFYDAFPDIATIAALWTICGMIIVAGMTPQVSGALKPIFNPIIPHSALAAAIFFAILGGIGNIYRGPLEVIGTGAALVAIMRAANVLPIPLLYALWFPGTVMSGSVDPTNSWTLWTIGYTKVTHGQFLKVALPFGMLMVVVATFAAYFMLGK